MPCIVTALVLRVVPFLLFIAVSIVLLVFGFEPFILGLYRGSALRAITLSISLELFDSLDYFISSFQPVCTYELFSEILWHLPPQLVVEVILFYWCQE